MHAGFGSFDEAVAHCISDQGPLNDGIRFAVEQMRNRDWAVPHIGVYTGFSFGLGSGASQETLSDGLLTMSEAGVVYAVPIPDATGLGFEEIQLFHIHGTQILYFTTHDVGRYVHVDWTLNGLERKTLFLSPTSVSAGDRVWDLFSCFVEIEQHWHDLG